jgi:hypothetical protein
MPRTHDAGLSHAPPPHMTSKLHPCQRAGLVRHASDNNRGVPHGCAARRATTVAARFVNCERALSINTVHVQVGVLWTPPLLHL